MKVGVVLPLAEDARTGLAPPYRFIQEMALQAETNGFDSLWLYDHLLYRDPGERARGIWECWTVLSALAAVTERVALGPLVLCIPFRNPAILAKMAATLDDVSGGRLVLGVGAGWNEPEFTAFGLPFDRLVSRFEEALEIMVPLLRHGSASFEGRYHRVDRCEIVPRGPSPDGPPLLIGATGPRMLRLTARHADAWNVAYLSSPIDLVEPLEALHRACDEEGRDPATVEVTVTVKVAYPDLAPVPPFMRDGYLSEAEEVADALHGFAEMGVGHVMIHTAPNTLAGLSRLTEALMLYRLT